MKADAVKHPADNQTSKKIGTQVLKNLVVLTAAVLLGSLSAGLTIVIGGSEIPSFAGVVCAFVLCLIPASAIKIITVLLSCQKKVSALWGIVGIAVSVWLSSAFYISHDYEISVYRYMKQTNFDVYYFEGGYESYLEDYENAQEFMDKLKSEPAAALLRNMSEEKVSRLTSEELNTINNESVWDYFGFDDILGVTSAEVEASMEKAEESQMSAYDFIFEYRGLHAKTTGYMLFHPKQLLSELRSLALTDSLYSIKLSSLVVFWIISAFAVWFFIIRIDVTDDKKIIYLSHISNRKK